MQQNRKLSDAYMLRLPDGWRDAIKARAAGNRRSMNQEILIALEGLIGGAAGEDFGEDAPLPVPMEIPPTEALKHEERNQRNPDR
ncbi:hypothetical protein CNY89_27535 [Amaricoccus sp. HAR-UPW-R2A-40]|nr:hypothetical protein CNY89_27535 [Amaricoccus sp. HAR-UPW-R2A-40]